MGFVRRCGTTGGTFWRSTPGSPPGFHVRPISPTPALIARKMGDVVYGFQYLPYQQAGRLAMAMKGIRDGSMGKEVRCGHVGASWGGDCLCPSVRDAVPGGVSASGTGHRARVPGLPRVKRGGAYDIDIERVSDACASPWAHSPQGWLVTALCWKAGKKARYVGVVEQKNR